MSSRRIFVFGSNLAGQHGGGSARAAVDLHGAIMGQGVGLQGDSYAIPTLDHHLRQLALHDIEAHVGDFIAFAEGNPHMTFDIVAIGCGIAGFTPEQIAPMFRNVPLNCTLPSEFIAVLDKMAEADLIEGMHQS